MLRPREPPATADLHAFLLGFVEGHDRSVAAVNAIEHLAPRTLRRKTPGSSTCRPVSAPRARVRAGAIRAGTGTSGALAAPVGSGPLRSRV